LEGVATGHFAAFEQPEIFVDDIRTFFFEVAPTTTRVAAP